LFISRIRYEIITANSVDLAIISIVEPSLSLAIRISVFDLGVLPSRNPLILTVRYTDCRLINARPTLALLLEATSLQVLDCRNGEHNDPHAPIHRATGYSLHRARLFVLPWWSWRIDATL